MRSARGRRSCLRHELVLGKDYHGADDYPGAVHHSALHLSCSNSEYIHGKSPNCRVISRGKIERDLKDGSVIQKALGSGSAVGTPADGAVTALPLFLATRGSREHLLRERRQLVSLH